MRMIATIPAKNSQTTPFIGSVGSPSAILFCYTEVYYLVQAPVRHSYSSRDAQKSGATSVLACSSWERAVRGGTAPQQETGLSLFLGPRSE